MTKIERAIAHRMYQEYLLFVLCKKNEEIRSYRCHYCQVALVGSLPRGAYDEGYRVIGMFNSMLQPVIACGKHAKEGEETIDATIELYELRRDL
jgi:hypothetical protein